MHFNLTGVIFYLQSYSINTAVRSGVQFIQLQHNRSESDALMVSNFRKEFSHIIFSVIHFETQC